MHTEERMGCVGSEWVDRVVTGHRGEGMGIGGRSRGQGRGGGRETNAPNEGKTRNGQINGEKKWFTPQGTPLGVRDPLH